MNCIYCGCLLEKTNWGRLWCPVCHEIVEEPKESEESKDETHSYIG
jgi:uncharacterized Zn finger protein (UPF0148 family)